MLTLEKKHKALIRLVDDDNTVLRALRTFLEIDDWRVETFQSGEAFLESDFSEPGCVVLDVRMPGLSGIEVHSELLRRKVRLPVIFLSAHGDIEMAVDAVHRGARTFLVKPPEPEKLLVVIESAVKSDFDERRLAEWARDLEASWAKLTPAEQLVAQMAAKGLTTTVIAEALGVGERTVKAHRAASLEKLDLANAVELSDFCHELQSVREKFPAGTCSEDGKRFQS